MGSDMTVGKPMRIILKFMLTMLAGNLFQQLYNMADTVIVGHFVGANALAAVGSTGTLMFLVLGVCQGMATGFSVLTGQRFGAHDEDATRRSVANGILLSAIVIGIMTLLSLLSVKPLLKLMNTPAAIYDDAKSYITVIFIGIACSMLYNLLSSYLRAVGNSQAPVYFLLLSAVLNIFLDLLLIIVFRMGVTGAAVATVISQGVSVVLCWIYMMKKIPVLAPRKEDWRLSRLTSAQQLKIGLPMALMFGITASGTTIMQAAINLFGEVAVSGVTAAGKISTLVCVGMYAIGQTMTAYSSQNFGVRNLDRLKEGIRCALIIMLVYSIAAGAVSMLLLPRLLPLFFSGSADIASMMPYASKYTLMCAVTYFPLNMIFIFRNSMQGCGYAILPTCVGVVEFFARLAVALLSMNLHSFTLAAGCDPFAWTAGGVFGCIAWLWVAKDIKKKLGL